MGQMNQTIYVEVKPVPWVRSRVQTGNHALVIGDSVTVIRSALTARTKKRNSAKDINAEKASRNVPMEHSVLIERFSATERHNARTVPMRLSHFVVVSTAREEE